MLFSNTGQTINKDSAANLINNKLNFLLNFDFQFLEVFAIYDIIKFRTSVMSWLNASNIKKQKGIFLNGFDYLMITYLFQ